MLRSFFSILEFFSCAVFVIISVISEFLTDFFNFSKLNECFTFSEQYHSFPHCFFCELAFCSQLACCMAFNSRWNVFFCVTWIAQLPQEMMWFSHWTFLFLPFSSAGGFEFGMYRTSGWRVVYYIIQCSVLKQSRDSFSFGMIWLLC